MPKKPNITAKIAPDVLLQEFKSKEFYFFALKISLFRKYVSYFKYRFDTPESLTNKGIKEKPIEMSYHKGSDFNRFFIAFFCLGLNCRAFLHRLRDGGLQFFLGKRFRFVLFLTLFLGELLFISCEDFFVEFISRFT